MTVIDQIRTVSVSAPARVGAVSGAAPDVAYRSDVARPDADFERYAEQAGVLVRGGRPVGVGHCDVLLVRTDRPTAALRVVVRETRRLVPTVVATTERDPAVLAAVVSAGVEGCLVDGHFDAGDLREALGRAARGEPTWSGPVVGAVVARLTALRGTAPASRCAALSERQREVMRLVAVGLGNTEIAARLFLSEKTVRNHVHNIYRVLGCSTRAEAMSCWHRAESLANGGPR